MIGKCLGLDITRDYVAAVLIRRGFQGYELLDCAMAPILGEGPVGVDRAIESVTSGMELGAGIACLCTLPAGDISFRQLRMPFADTKKISQTVAFEMESLLPVAVDEVLVDFTVAARLDTATAILAGACGRKYLSETIARLQTFGLTPLILDIQCVPLVLHLFNKPGTPANFMLLDWAAETITLIICRDRRIAFIRSLCLAAAAGSGNGVPLSEIVINEIQNTLRVLQTELCPVIIDTLFLNGPAFSDDKAVTDITTACQLPGSILDLGQEILPAADKTGIAPPFDHRYMNNALALALRETKRWRGFNYLFDEFRSNRPFLHYHKEIQKGALMILLLLALFVIDGGMDYFSLKNRYDAAEQQLIQGFRQDFPDSARVVDPVGQLRAKMKELSGTAGAAPAIASKAKAIDLIREVSAAIDPNISINVARMVIDQDSAQLAGSTDNFNTVNIIEKMLEKSSYFQDVTISSANLDKSGKVVHFEIRMTRKL